MRQAAILVTLGMAIASPASATSLARLTVEQMTDASEYIVRGTVTETWTEQDVRGTIWTKARVSVDSSLKGDAPGTLVVESIGGTLAEQTHDVHLAARYAPGEEVFLFVARKGESDRLGTVAMFAGKYTIRINPADGSEMVVSYTVSYERPYDARFIPNPPADERISLASMEAQVAARVAAGWDGAPIPGISSDRLRVINKLQAGVQ